MSIQQTISSWYPLARGRHVPRREQPDPTATTPFDLTPLSNAKETTFIKLAKLAQRTESLSILRKLTPVVRTPRIPWLNVPSFVLLFRFDHVAEVLQHDDAFAVLGERIKRGNDGINFLLGMQDDGACPRSQAGAVRTGCPMHALPSDGGYRDFQRDVQRFFRLEDLPRIGQIVEDHVETVLEPGRDHVDGMAELVTGTIVELCKQYYGLDIPDPEALKAWCFMISRWYFDPLEPSEFETSARVASKHLRALIEASIDASPKRRDAGDASRKRRDTGEDTVLARMLEAKLGRDRIRVILSGMVLGFIPTSTMAGEHVLNQLLDRQDMQTAARRAAQTDDHTALQRCLLEAFRFSPLDREPLRICTQQYTLSTPSLWGRTRLHPGDHVMTMTRSAMMDDAAFAAPHKFDPERPSYNSMLFGYGLHRCIGAPIAETHLVHIFKVLLANHTMRRDPAAAPRALGPFATSLPLCIEHAHAAKQSRGNA